MHLRNQRGFFVVENVNRAVFTDLEQTVREAETAYRTQISRVVTQAAGRRILLISGPSSSGKTTTAHRIFDELLRRGIPAVSVSLDDFYKNRSQLPIIDGRPNAEVLQALEVDLIIQTLMQLMQEGCARLPEFDFVTGQRRDGVHSVTVPKNGVILVEGLHALNSGICDLLPKDDLFRIYVSPHRGFIYGEVVILTKRDVRFIRRLVRDFRTRGCDGQRTFELWDDVCAGEDAYIRPFRRYADWRINTAFSYECGLLRDQALAILSAITPQSVYYTKAQALCSSLDRFYPVPGDCLPQDSLLHEFYG